jgi:hypothetical protein
MSKINRTTIHTSGKKIPGLKFQGEMMTCVMCGKEEKSDPKVESGWTCVEVDGKGYYVCPAEIPVDGIKQQYEIAYRKILTKIAALPREQPHSRE